MQTIAHFPAWIPTWNRTGTMSNPAYEQHPGDDGVAVAKPILLAEAPPLRHLEIRSTKSDGRIVTAIEILELNGDRKSRSEYQKPTDTFSQPTD